MSVTFARRAGNANARRVHPTRDEVGFDRADQLFIDPVHCIGCGLCVDECPVRAIFQIDDVPAEWSDFIEKNAAYYRPGVKTPGSG